ncbi:MAG: hypothetical protein FWC67_02635, partial [Defluviitaleaceae bacterium]|nr:hypothetical protein [Defluviitaleaceae bacterium]
MMTGLHVGVSGLRAAQMGLYVTGHNMANHNVLGYSRQLLGQAHFIHRNVGQNANGVMQIGLGTDMTGIRQVRNHWFDLEYRQAMPALAYWERRANTHIELDAIFGEMEGQYRLQAALDNLNAALNELNNDPASRETRANFISQAGVFIDRANSAARSIFEYQMELNNDVKMKVQRINQIITDIHDLNGRIVEARNFGVVPNDFMDWRNNLLDELSGMIDITIIEIPGGSINI